jgi:hypothetical protein
MLVAIFLVLGLVIKYLSFSYSSDILRLNLAL